MSVYRRFDTEGYPSLVTTNAANRRPVFHSDAAAALLIEIIYEVRRETAFPLLAFVVMPDHIHLVLSPSSVDSLAKIMQLVKGRFARRNHSESGDRGSLWQSRYHEQALRAERELFDAIEYVHRNPVSAGLASAPQDYPWSSASGRFAVDLASYLGQAEA